MNIWKAILTWPYLLQTYSKSGAMTRKVLRDPSLVPEAKRYVWLKKRVRYIKWLYNVKLTVHNLENWPKRKGCVMVANHQSNFDPLLVLSVNDYSLHAPLGFIAKAELKKNHLARRFIFLIDVLFIDRNNPRTAVTAFQEAKELIRVPRTMMIFPEGTRSHHQQMQEFKPGALKMAYQAYVPIIPVTIINSYQIFDQKYKGKKDIHLIFHQPIEPSEFIKLSTDILSKQVFNIIKKGIDDFNNKKI
ncbi:lysophospholipid acyltransferase family protein [Spiroplasma endosymbiont of Polydrusus pterygomalis]|uniref:lysophospholipid acyltransferase family protein n=1 Tax=Spiroplasma endosymbiont of Polydrusus pterygomalis TaxID=3139327 RepID=UPI003CCA82DB